MTLKTIYLFTIPNGISPNLQALLLRFVHPSYVWVDDPAKADYMVLPTNYEVGHELSDYYLNYFKGVPQDKALALDAEDKLIKFSIQFNKPVLIFFFSDSNEAIPIQNKVLFRTSILASKADSNELTMPAFKESQLSFSDNYAGALPWIEKPSVGFRGQAFPLKIVGSRSWKNAINTRTYFYCRKKPFNIRGIESYLLRRNAISVLKKQRNINTDIDITSEQDIHNDKSAGLFKESVVSNPYTLCLAGVGNYSYRLYEVLSAGRIPVFINTDCKLPFEDVINWKEHMVWVEDWQLPRIGEILLRFHQQHKGEAFSRLQESNHQLWKKYLSKEGFLTHIQRYL